MWMRGLERKASLIQQQTLTCEFCRNMTACWFISLDQKDVPDYTNINCSDVQTDLKVQFETTTQWEKHTNDNKDTWVWMRAWKCAENLHSLQASTNDHNHADTGSNLPPRTKWDWRTLGRCSGKCGIALKTASRSAWKMQRQGSRKRVNIAGRHSTRASTRGKLIRRSITWTNLKGVSGPIIWHADLSKWVVLEAMLHDPCAKCQNITLRC